MLNHSFTWNGKSSEEFGIRIEKYRNINRPARKHVSQAIYGRNGNVYSVSDAWEELNQSYQIFAKIDGESPVVTFGDIMEWLTGVNGYGKLTDTYDPNHYREAVFVNSVDIENTWNQIGRAVITFRCRPERFLITNDVNVEFDQYGYGSIINPTKHISKPIIHITGAGTPSLFKAVDRTAVRPNSPRSLNPLPTNYDTPYDNLVYYGVYPSVDIFENALVGGINFRADRVGLRTTMASAGMGMPVRVSPNTIYSIHAINANATTEILKMDIYMYDAAGWLQSKTTASRGTDVSGTEYTRLHFKTSSTTAWVMIVFRTQEADTAYYSYNVMMTATEDYLPFVAYDETPSRITIANKWQLDFDLGFGDLYIDCDKENIYADGRPFNNYTTITPLFGVDKDSFPHLLPGENIIEAGSPITGVTIEPRFWEV